VATHKFWHILKYYFALFLILFVLNSILAYYFYTELLNKVGEIQLFILFLYGGSAVLVKWIQKVSSKDSVGLLLGSVGVKMMAALIYLLPIVLGDNQQ